jgi:hypothetical protein
MMVAGSCGGMAGGWYYYPLVELAAYFTRLVVFLLIITAYY